MKKCSCCQILKQEDEFWRVRKGQPKLQNKCKACGTAMTREWRRKNPERSAELSMWAKKNPDKVRSKLLLKLYGLTPADWDRMLADQDGGCAICGDNEPARGFHVDHCHKTGRVRGLLCTNCNHGIGNFSEDPKTILEAARYVMRDQLIKLDAPVPMDDNQAAEFLRDIEEGRAIPVVKRN
jgi:hypothetical protein